MENEIIVLNCKLCELNFSTKGSLTKHIEKNHLKNVTISTNRQNPNKQVVKTKKRKQHPIQIQLQKNHKNATFFSKKTPDHKLIYSAQLPRKWARDGAWVWVSRCSRGPLPCAREAQDKQEHLTAVFSCGCRGNRSREQRVRPEVCLRGQSTTTVGKL